MHTLTHPVTADKPTGDQWRRHYHQIGDITVDMVFSNDSLARREQESLADWLSRELLPALDELFSFAAPGEQIIRFESLEFDFGNLPASDYRQIIREQLLQKLARLINEKQLPLTIQREERLLVNHTTDATLALQHLLHYLQTGRFSAQLTTTNAHAVSTDRKLHQQLLDSIVDIQQIATQLRALPKRNLWVTRLLKQFSERHRVALLRQLAPGQVALALALLDLLQLSDGKTLSHHQDWQITATWHSLFEIALDAPTLINKEWLAALIKKMAASTQTDELGLLHTLIAHGSSILLNSPITRSSPASENANTTLHQHWQQLKVMASELLEKNNPPVNNNNPVVTHDKQKHHANDRTDNKTELTDAQSLTIQRRLASILIAGDAIALVQQWPQLLQYHKPLLIAGLKHYLVKTELRNQLLHKLQVDFIPQLLMLLAPASQPLLSAFAHQQVQYNALLQSLKKNPAIANRQSQESITDNALTTAEWLRSIYGIIANYLFKAPLETNGEPITFIATEYLLHEITTRFANQHNLAPSELYKLWKPLFDKKIDGSTFDDSATSSTSNQTTAGTDPATTNPSATYTDSASIQQRLASLLIAGDATALMQQWPQLLSHHKPLLIAGLKYYLCKAELRQQLLFRLAVDFIPQLLGVLAPASEKLLSVFMQHEAQLDALAKYLADRNHTAAGSPSHLAINQIINQTTNQTTKQTPANTQWLRAIYEIIGNLLFTSHPTNNSDAIVFSFTGKTLYAITEHYANQQNIPAAGLYELWEPVFNGQLDIDPIDNIEHAPTINTTPIDSENNIQLPVTAEQQLNQLFINADIHEWRRLWPDLQHRQREAARIAIQRHWFKADIRQPLIQKLPLPFIQDILLLIAPALNGLIQTLIQQQPQLIAEAHSLSSASVSSGLNALRGENWLRALFNLLSDVIPVPANNSSHAAIISIPSPMQLVEELARDYARRENLPTDALAFIWRRVFESANSNTLDSSDRTFTSSATPSDTTQLHSNSPSAVDSKPFANTDWQQKTANELFDWCLILKTSSHHRASLPKDTDLLRRLIHSFISQSPAFSADFRDVFLSSIETYAAQTTQTTYFLSQLLFNLIDGQLIDFETLVQDSNPALASHTQEHALRQRTAVDTGINTPENHLQEIHRQEKNEIKTPNHTEEARENSYQAADENHIEQRMNQLLQELLSQQIDPFGLHMSPNYWQRLVAQYFYREHATSNTHHELLQAIHEQASSAVNIHYFYQQIMHALVHQQPLDLEHFALSPARDNTVKPTARYVQDPLVTLADSEAIQSIHLPIQDARTTERTTPETLGSEDIVQQPTLSLEQLLLNNDTPGTEQLQQLQQHVNLLLQHYTPGRAQEWLSLLRNNQAATQLIQWVPAHLLHQIVLRLHPAPFAALEPLVKLATDALALLLPKADPLMIKQAKWEFIFKQLFNTSALLDATELLKRCCEYLAQTAGLSDAQRLVQLAERRLALLKPVATQRPNMSLDEDNKNTEPALNFDAGMHLNNVGQVLAAPFLPRLFTMLNLTVDGKFIHPEAADRAIHLLQFMVTGQSQTAEYELTLNKILCGVSTSMPISEGIDITEQEQTIIEQMLQSMIQHWRALGSTSIAGLRETFLQRQGWLVLDDEYWRLKVQEHTFDMLLDRLPWSISLIKHSWMDKPLRVSWREQS